MSTTWGVKGEREGLPQSAVLAVWFNAAVRAEFSPPFSPRQIADVVRADDAAHIVTGANVDGFDLCNGIAHLRDRGFNGAWTVLPLPGDPAGLAGADAYQRAALERGQATVFTTSTPLPGHTTDALAWVPQPDTRVVRWWSMPAGLRPPEEGPAEAGAWLRQVLAETTHRLVDLDVASWQPEIPDLLANLRHREPPQLPAGFNAAMAQTVDRALLCAEIVHLALVDEGGAVSAGEMNTRRVALRELQQVAHRALVACCSPIAFGLS